MSFIDRFFGRHPKVKRVYDVLMEISDKTESTHLFMLSAGIAFNILVYLIPLFLVSIYVVNLLVDIDDLAVTVEQILFELLPPNESTEELLHSVVVEVGKITEHTAFFGVIGIIALLWVSSILISSVRLGLNTMFELPSEKFFLFYRLKDMLLTVIFCVLVLIYAYVVPATSLFSELLADFLPAPFQQFFSSTFLMAISATTSLLIFYFVYSYVPNKKLPRFIRYSSIAMSMVFIEISRNVFAWYISGVADYGKFYGGYAIVISVAIWIYYSSLIILFSGLLSKYLYDKFFNKEHKKLDVIIQETEMKEEKEVKAEKKEKKMKEQREEKKV